MQPESKSLEIIMTGTLTRIEKPWRCIKYFWLNAWCQKKASTCYGRRALEGLSRRDPNIVTQATRCRFRCRSSISSGDHDIETWAVNIDTIALFTVIDK